jgi:hypothetical protein
MASTSPYAVCRDVRALLRLRLTSRRPVDLGWEITPRGPAVVGATPVKQSSRLIKNSGAYRRNAALLRASHHKPS